MINVNSISGVTDTKYNAYDSSDYKAKEQKNGNQTTGKETQAAVYEKSSDVQPATYSINKMSESDRAALVKQLQTEQQSRQEQFINLVKDIISGQSKSYAIASEDDIWKFLASGDYTVSEAAKIQAQQDIAEDGYYGVEQTSQRLFDFASALAGDDVDRMKDMQEAMKQGYEEAMGIWGKELPEICQQTIDAADKMFEDYYASKQTVTE